MNKEKKRLLHNIKEIQLIYKHTKNKIVKQKALEIITDLRKQYSNIKVKNIESNFQNKLSNFYAIFLAKELNVNPNYLLGEIKKLKQKIASGKLKDVLENQNAFNAQMTGILRRYLTKMCPDKKKCKEENYAKVMQALNSIEKISGKAKDYEILRKSKITKFSDINESALYIIQEYINAGWFLYFAKPIVKIIVSLWDGVKKLFKIISKYIFGNNEEEENDAYEVANKNMTGYFVRLHNWIIKDVLNEKEKMKYIVIMGLYNLIYRGVLILVWYFLLKGFIRIYLDVRYPNGKSYFDDTEDKYFVLWKDQLKMAILEEEVDMVSRRNVEQPVVSLFDRYLERAENLAKDMLENPVLGLIGVVLSLALIYNILYFIKDLAALSSVYGYYYEIKDFKSLKVNPESI